MLNFLRILRVTNHYNSTIENFLHSSTTLRKSNVTHCRHLLIQSTKSYQIFHNHSPFVPVASATPVNLSTPAGTASEVLEQLHSIVQLCSSGQAGIDDSRFETFAKNFKSKIQTLHEQDLLEVLRQFSLLAGDISIADFNYVDMWNSLDVECCRRRHSWSREHQLLVWDALYETKLITVASYTKETLSDLGRKVDKMQLENMVQTAFFCAAVCAPIADMKDFEQVTVNFFDQLTLAELGIVALSFFNTGSAFCSSSLVHKIYQRMLLELDKTDEASLCNLLKTLAQSSKKAHFEYIDNVTSAIQSKADYLTIQTLLAAGFLGTRTQTRNDALLEVILGRCDKDFSKLTMTDVRNTLYLVAGFSYQSPNGVDMQFYNKILDMLRQHPYHAVNSPGAFVDILHFLKLEGVQDSDLIAGAFDERFIEHASLELQKGSAKILRKKESCFYS